MSSPWTSLEVVKVAVSLLTPLTVVGLGFLIAGRTRRVDDLRWANQAVVQRRMELFQDLAPSLNKLLCFATFVGRWKELPPQAVLALKRELDEVVHTNRLLFSPEVFAAYSAFMSTFFEMWATVDGDALLKVAVSSRHGDRRNMPWWTPDMQLLFVDEQRRSTPEEVRQAYDALQAGLQRDLYVTTTSGTLH